MLSFFEPVNIDFDFDSARDFGLIGGIVSIHLTNNLPKIDTADIIIIGVPEDRNAVRNEGTKHAPDEIRKAFYQLFPGEWNQKIVDLGNLKLTSEVADTYEILKEVISRLSKDVAIILLGGSQELILPVTEVWDTYNKTYNISVIDALIDSALTDDSLDNENYLTRILTNSTSKLQNMSIFGVQTYYNHPVKYEIFKQLFVDYHKLGEMQENVNEIEPELREADLVSIDINSIKNADMPAQSFSRPNGFTGKEICMIARNAGIAVQNKVLGIFEYNPFFDKNYAGANLIAQILWYYVEGKNVYQEDYPNIPVEKLMKFYVSNELLKLIFYKNPETERWWVEIPDIVKEQVLFSCSENDYQQAIKLKITKRIYQIINKMTI